MTGENTSQDQQKAPEIKRRSLLKTAAVVLVRGGYWTGYGLLGVVDLDTATSERLSATTNEHFVRGLGRGTLSVVTPGLMAPNVEGQTGPLHQTWLDYGDALFIQPTGRLYDEAKFADAIADKTEKTLSDGDYDRVILNPVSMTGNPAADALIKLNDRGVLEHQSVEPTVILYDTPASKDDIAESYRHWWAAAGAEYRAGQVSNLFPKVNGVDASFAASQLEALTDREALPSGSLDFVDNLVYWESLKGGNLVDAERSIADWRRTVRKNSFTHVEVNMGHVEFEKNRARSHVAIAALYAEIHNNISL